MAGLLALSLLLGMPALAVETPAGAAPAAEAQVSPLAAADMGDESRDIPVDGLRYLPRQGNQLNGTITQYEIWASTDGDQFVKIASGDWAADHEWKTASFTPYYIQYIKLVAVNACDEGGAKFASAAEIRVTQADVEEPYALSSFTEESHGGWQVGADSGTGTIAFADNEMELWGTGANGNTAYCDAQSPALANGYVQATITPVTTSRFALLYRYTDSTHYTGISYDDSKWGWCGNGGNKWGGLTADASKRGELALKSDRKSVV